MARVTLEFSGREYYNLSEFLKAHEEDIALGKYSFEKLHFLFTSIFDDVPRSPDTT